MVGIWAIRLSGFLLWRVLKDGEDKRFRGIKHTPVVYISWWMMQGLWVFVTGLEVYITNLRSEDPHKIDASMVTG